MAKDTPAERIPNESPSGKQGALLELAKKRLAAVDVRADGKDDGDEALRQEALKYIQKECLGLPDFEFMKLLTKIEDALKRKDAEMSSVRTESQTALKEVSRELALLPFSNFDPQVKNPKEVAEYLAKSVSTIDKMNEFWTALRKNSECLSWFLKNWKEGHPVREELKKMGFHGEHLVKSLDNDRETEEITLRKNDTLEGVTSRAEKAGEALSKFKNAIGNGFPKIGDPKTVEEMVEIFKHLEGNRLSDPILILTDNPKNTLAFLGEWAKQPNALAQAMENHPVDSVCFGYVALNAAFNIGAIKYGYDPNCLPLDFPELLKHDSERFERRYERAQKTKEWNAESRSFLTDQWNALVKARTEGDARASAKIWAEVDAFFQGEFQYRNAQVNEWFLGLVGEQQPDAFREFQAIATTKMLFASVRMSFDDGNESAAAKKADAGTVGKLRRLDENFRDMMGGSITSLLVDDGKGWLESKDFSNFVSEVSEESSSQAMKYPEGVARYLSITYAKGGKEAFAQTLRSDFWNKYDAIVLKLADVAGYVSKNGSANGEAWAKIQKTLVATDPETYGVFQEFLENETETILANKKAIGEEDSATVRNILEKKGSKSQIDKALEAMRGKSTKEQFDILLREFPKLTHGEVEAVFTEISRKSKDASEAHGIEADRLIPTKEIMEYVPGFVTLKHELAIRPENETVREAERRTDLLRRLQASNRMFAGDFYDEFKNDADVIVRVLEKYAKSNVAYKGDCENLAAWFRHKRAAWNRLKDAVTEKGVADTAKKLSAKNGNGALAGTSADEYRKDIDTNVALSEQLLRAKERADALERAWRVSEAAELRKQVFWRADWSLSNDLPNLEEASKGVEKALKDGRFWFETGKTGKEAANKGAEVASAGTSPSAAAEAISAGLAVGREVKVPLEGTATDVRVLRTGNLSSPFVVSVNGKPSYSCTEKDLAANLEMAQFLSLNGLAFLAPVSSELLKRSSVAKGSLSTAEDGDFGDKEKRDLLSAAAKALKIEGFPHSSTDVSEMSARFSRISRDEWTSVQETGIRNGVLDESGNVRNVEEFLASAT